MIEQKLRASLRQLRKYKNQLETEKKDLQKRIQHLKSDNSSRFLRIEEARTAITTNEAGIDLNNAEVAQSLERLKAIDQDLRELADDLEQIDTE